MYQSIITSLKQIKTRSPTPFMGTAVLALVAAFPFFLLGYDVAITRASSSIADDLSLNVDQIDHFVATVHWWMAAGGALVAGIAANYVGRKYTAAFGGGLYTVGVLTIAFAHSYAVSICGRAVAGFGIGMGLLVGPIYIAEFAPASVRSFLGHFPQVMMALGMMTAYILDAAFVWFHHHTSWRLIIGISALPSLAFTAMICYFMDSPCWMVMLGNVDLAEEMLKACRGPKKEADEDSDEEEEDNEVEARMTQLKKVAGLDPYCNGNNIRGAPGRIIGVRAIFDDMFNGDPIFRPVMKTSILLITQEAILEDLIFQTFRVALEWNGFRCCFSSSVAGALLSFIKLLSSMLSARWANGTGGRKTLLITSLLLAGCSLGAFSATIVADAHGRIGHGTAFALYSAEVVVLEVAVGFGIGPYPWMYGPEAFPLPIRAPCLAFCIVAKFSFRFMLKMLLPLVYAPFEGIWAAFVLASGIQILSMLLCCLFVRDSTSEILVDHLD
ncbi:Polyol transporter 5 [Linum grandiflorum]